MMCRMTAIAESHQIGWLVTSAGRPRHKVVNISLGPSARLCAFDAAELVAPEYAFPDPAPIPLDCPCQTDFTPWMGANEYSLSSNVRTAVGVLKPFATKRS